MLNKNCKHYLCNPQYYALVDIISNYLMKNLLTIKLLTRQRFFLVLVTTTSPLTRGFNFRNRLPSNLKVLLVFSISYHNRIESRKEFFNY